jgi:lysophospholipase L1-like esterase
VSGERNDRLPSRSRRALGWVVLIGVNVAFLGLLEFGARLYLASHVGASVLAYGTRWHDAHKQEADERFERTLADDPATHTRKVGGYQLYDPTLRNAYSKYEPGEKKHLRTADTDELVSVRINDQGFRGADFAIEKPPGTVRVITLGASSTFGYGVRDHETYPHQLEEILSRTASPGTRFEVLNFGIPHSTSANLVALFVAEGLPLRPDVVTFYEGANDSAIVDREREAARLWTALRARLLLFEFADHTWKTLRPPVELWSDDYAAHRSEIFLANLDRLRVICAENGVRLVVATQQARSLVFLPEVLRTKKISYAGEVQLVEAFVHQDGEAEARTDRWRQAFRSSAPTAPYAVAPVYTRDPAVVAALTQFSSLDKARVFLIHARLMRDLRAWASAHEVPFVDAIAALDSHRGEIFSWIHLTPAGNRALAEALAPAILKETR